MSERLELPTESTSRALMEHSRLRRVVYAISLHPYKKFGSLEEQIWLLACAFQEQGSLFLPLFISPLDVEHAARYRAAGLETALLDLRRFRWRTLWHLVQLLRKQRIEVVHWNFFGPINWHVWFLTLLTPRVQHYFTDHNTRFLPIEPCRRPLKKAFKRLLLKRYRKVFGISDYVVQYLHKQQTWSRD